mmetsp:Transcript_69354/g.200920  ORF Transcript_69354/g.200920 Transcript_69354/m.200920 type:complete len:220 (+) Transcript_69354:2191-2850(+)
MPAFHRGHAPRELGELHRCRPRLGVARGRAVRAHRWGFELILWRWPRSRWHVRYCGVSVQRSLGRLVRPRPSESGVRLLPPFAATEAEVGRARSGARQHEHHDGCGRRRQRRLDDPGGPRRHRHPRQGGLPGRAGERRCHFAIPLPRAALALPWPSSLPPGGGLLVLHALQACGSGHGRRHLGTPVLAAVLWSDSVPRVAQRFVPGIVDWLAGLGGVEL